MYTGCFDITGKYNPALERLTYAQVWFPVSDDQWFDPQESVAVDLGDQPFLGPESATLNLLSDKISGGAFATLDTTGKLKYTICRTEGDFLAWGAKLLVQTCPRAVPDGGTTLMLFGVALAGIESLRRGMARTTHQRIA